MIFILAVMYVGRCATYASLRVMNAIKLTGFFVVELLCLIIIANAASKQGMWRVTKNTNN